MAGAFALGAGPVAAALRHAPERIFSMLNLHTGEALETVYWAEGGYVTSAMREIDWLMRDYRTDEVIAMDPALIDLLDALRRTLGTKAPFELISGYRSPKTNAMLNARSNGVAKHSLHIDGMAADIRLPDRRLGDVQKAAISLRKGGVGFYPKSNFVHVDTGRVRYW